MEQQDRRQDGKHHVLGGAVLGGAAGLGAHLEGNMIVGDTTSKALKQALQARVLVPAGVLGGAALGGLAAAKQHSSLQPSSERLQGAYQNFHARDK